MVYESRWLTLYCLVCCNVKFVLSTISFTDPDIYQVPVITEFNFLSFEVQACGDADLEFIPYPGLYLNIGGYYNSRTVLLHDGSTVNYDDVLLDCSRFKTFWVAVNTYIFQFGKGTFRNNNTILSYGSQCPMRLDKLTLRTNFGKHIMWRNLLKGLLGVINGRFCGNEYKSCNKMTEINATYSSSIIECASLCKLMEECRIVAYDNTTRLCRMFSNHKGSDGIVSIKVYWKC